MKRFLPIAIVVAALLTLANPSWAKVQFIQKDTGGVCMDFLSGVTNTQSWCWDVDGNLTINDGVTATPSITFTDGTGESSVLAKADGADTTLTTVAADSFRIVTGNLRVGNGVAATAAMNGEDAYIEGDLEVAGTATFTGAINNGTAGVTLDDGVTDTPALTFQDGTDETAVFVKKDSANLQLTTLAADGLQIVTGNLFVGNGTPDETINGEDLYVEGISEFDGTANFDGIADFDGGITVGSTTVNTAALTAQGRGFFEVCGDATTVNNNTVYYGPDQTVVSSATVGQMKCDTTAAGNVTEATADTPALAGTAIYPLGMVCYIPDPGATVTFTLRSAAAAITPAIAVSIADNVTSGTASATATTAIAADATVAVAVASTGDLGTLPFICRVSYAF